MKLTAEKCEQLISEMSAAKWNNTLSLKEELYYEALCIALEVLDKKDKK